MSRGRISRLELTGELNNRARVRALTITGGQTVNARVRALSITGSIAAASARVRNLSITGTVPSPRARVRHLSIKGGALGAVSAQAGGGRVVEPLATFTLDGTASTGYTSGSWSQAAGTTITLTAVPATGGMKVTGTAPASYDGEDLVFELTVTDGTVTDTDQASLSVPTHQFWTVVGGAIVPRIPFHNV